MLTTDEIKNRQGVAMRYPTGPSTTEVMTVRAGCIAALEEPELDEQGRQRRMTAKAIVARRVLADKIFQNDEIELSAEERDLLKPAIVAANALMPYVKSELLRLVDPAEFVGR